MPGRDATTEVFECTCGGNGCTYRLNLYYLDVLAVEIRHENDVALVELSRKQMRRLEKFIHTCLETGSEE